MLPLLGIPYVNRPDLLRRALDSVEPLWPAAVLLDNSEDGHLVQDARDWPVPVHRVAGLAPLSVTQSLNLLQHMAAERGCRAWLFMHSDAEASAAVIKRLLTEVDKALKSSRPWGAIFTRYDLLCAFHTAAVRSVGCWDTNLPQYFADNDYYRRLQLAGYTIRELKLRVKHHEGGSRTINSDARRLLVNHITFPLHQRYYEAKWGGPPGQERFTRPFDSELFETSPGAGLLVNGAARKGGNLRPHCSPPKSRRAK